MLLVNKYTSIKQLVSSQIIDFLSIYTAKENFSQIANLDFKALFRLEKPELNKVLYRSSLALKISKLCGQSVCEFAENLASHLRLVGESEWVIQEGEQGWIEIEIGAGLVAGWLQNWVGLERVNRGVLVELEESTMQFDAQYAHARCCSLIRLAVQEGLIPTVDSEIQFPWCDRHILRFQDIAEWNLLGNLIDATDAIAGFADNSVQSWQKYAQRLSTGFERFWRECNIFGRTKIRDKSLAQARIGLVIVTRQVLRELLERKLHQVAIDEL